LKVDGEDDVAQRGGELKGGAGLRWGLRAHDEALMSSDTDAVDALGERQ